MARKAVKAELAEMGGIVTVEPPADFGIRSVWADPASVTPNDANWKVHPDDQREAVGDLIDRHGWLKPFLFNTRSGKLVDGHARLQVAVEKGVKAVPLWLGEWDDAAEAEILALLDETARMAEAEPDKLQALLGRMRPTTTRALGEVMGRLKAETGLAEVIARVAPKPPAPPPPPFVADPDGPPAAADGTGPVAAPGPDDFAAAPAAAVPVPPPASYVRMVQLFLNGETLPEFNAMVQALAPVHNTVTTTDTVMAVLREARDRLAPGPPEGEP